MGLPILRVYARWGVGTPGISLRSHGWIQRWNAIQMNTAWKHGVSKACVQHDATGSSIWLTDVMVSHFESGIYCVLVLSVVTDSCAGLNHLHWGKPRIILSTGKILASDDNRVLATVGSWKKSGSLWSFCHGKVLTSQKIWAVFPTCWEQITVLSAQFSNGLQEVGWFSEVLSTLNFQQELLVAHDLRKRGLSQKLFQALTENN